MASLQTLAAVHAEHGHIQEIILQNFVPHQRYYGREPAEIADTAAAAYFPASRSFTAGGAARRRPRRTGITFPF